MNSINFLIHLDTYFQILVTNYHNYIYLFLFIVIYCETGLVVTPFLPGDSLLFIAGSAASIGNISISFLIIIIITAAFCGDNTNFFIGKFLGIKLFTNSNSKIFRQDFLNQANIFYESHGRIAIIVARFIPIIRTFAPFVAGISQMRYPIFIANSLIASSLWVLIFVGGGYLFGNIPIVKNHISIFILIIILITLIPIFRLLIIQYLKK